MKAEDMMHRKIAIVGRRTETENYVNYVRAAGATPVVTLSMGELIHCHGLILPGGGDITPAFFGERNHGSRNINTELDIVQFQALEFCMKHKLPVLGICKGMQIINVGLGGSLIQDLPTSHLHRYENGDKYHASVTRAGSLLHRLYGDSPLVNSAHHQGIHRIGRGLSAIQWCPEDGCIEAICHNSLPILGVQWHPERISSEQAGISGSKILSWFASYLPGKP